MKIKSTHFFKHIPIYAFIFFSALSVSLMNPANPFSSLALKTDSAVFSYIGKAMHEMGAVPYRDIFDHKGPLLYLFNYIGHAIDNSLLEGIFIVEFVLLIVDFAFIYKIAKKATNDAVVSACTTAVSAIFLSIFYCGGNFSEMYALPFIIISLYLFAEYYFELDELPKFKIAVIGLCFGSVVMIRPNMIAVWAVFCISLIVYFIFEKNYKNILTSMIMFLIGTAAAILPFIIYLAANSALADFIYDYWTFNLNYSDRVEQSFMLVFKIINVYLNPIIGIAIVSYIISIFKHKDDRRKLFFDVSMLAACIVSLYLIAAPGNLYLHYGIPLVPCIVPGIAYALKLVSESAGFKSRMRFSKTVLKVCALFAFTGLIFYTHLWEFLRQIITTNTYELSQSTQTLHEFIIENTDEDEEILVVGNFCSIYLETDRMSSSKYIYQIPISDVDEGIQEYVMDEIKQNKSAVIVFPKIQQEKQISQKCMELLDTMDSYRRIDEELSITDEYIIYERIN